MHGLNVDATIGCLSSYDDVCALIDASGAENITSGKRFELPCCSTLFGSKVCCPSGGVGGRPIADPIAGLHSVT